MHLLALDIEAANRYVKGSICSIGLVFLDDELQVLSTNNLLINPKAKIKLNFKDKPIDLGFTDEELKVCPTFADYYDDLYRYLSGDYLVIGHSVKNDILMLDSACKRFRLPSFKFDYFCSQDLYKIFSGNDQQSIGLGKVSAMLSIDEYAQHNAVEDSIMSVRLIEYVMKEKNLTFDQMVKELKITFGHYEDFTVTNMYSPYHPHTIKLAAHAEENKRLQQGAKAERKNKAEFYAATVMHLPAQQRAEECNPLIDGKRCIMSRMFTTDEMLALGVRILQNGGKLVADLRQANVFIMPKELSEKQMRACRMYSYLLHYPELLDSITVIRDSDI